MTKEGRDSIQMILQHTDEIFKKLLHQLEVEEEQNRTESESDFLSDDDLSSEGSLEVFN